MIFLESSISLTAVFVLAYCRTQPNSTLQYLQLAPMNILKEAPYSFFLMKILDIFNINGKIRTNGNGKCKKSGGLRPSFWDVLRGKMRVELVNLYAFHMRKCIFLGFSHFSRWKVVIFLAADGTHMFVKENEAKNPILSELIFLIQAILCIQVRVLHSSLIRSTAQYNLLEVFPNFWSW